MVSFPAAASGCGGTKTPMDLWVEVLTPHAHLYLSEQAIRDTVEAVVDKSSLWEAFKLGLGTHYYYAM
jgi:hypothetical protein